MRSMHKRSVTVVVLGWCLWALAGVAWAEDPGKETIGTLKAEMIFATDGDPGVLGHSAKGLSAEEQERLEVAMRKKFKDYRRLGVDRKPILRGYENWSSPMSGSEELMVSFEPKERVGADALRLDMGLWQSKQKVLKTDPVLRKGKQLYIVGPKWRGGQLIIVVDLLPE